MSFYSMTGNHVKSLDGKVFLTLFLTNPLLVFNETVTYRIAEHILLRTLASVAKYKKARNQINSEINRHLKIVKVKI